VGEIIEFSITYLNDGFLKNVVFLRGGRGVSYKIIILISLKIHPENK
jgi:hypothetical protein